jgi:drug/metabolite transporter (DMT)-like permease
MPTPNRPITALTAAVVIWATTFVVSADALRASSPAVLTTARFALAAATLLPLAVHRQVPLRTAVRSPAGAFLGLTGVAAYYGLQNLGLLQTTPGTAALLQALLPIATAGLAVVFLQERLTRPTITGLVLSSVGVALVASAGFRVDLGAVLIMAGVVSYACYTVALRRLSDRGQPWTQPLTVATASTLWGALFLIPWLAEEIATGHTRWPTTTAADLQTLYLGVVASAGTLLLWSYGATRTPASICGILTAGIPALGYTFAVLQGEPATWAKTIGGILAICGIALATTTSSARTAQQQDATARNDHNSRSH